MRLQGIHELEHYRAVQKKETDQFTSIRTNLSMLEGKGKPQNTKLHTSRSMKLKNILTMLPIFVCRALLENDDTCVYGKTTKKIKKLMNKIHRNDCLWWGRRR